MLVDLPRGGQDEALDGGAAGDEGAQTVDADQVRKDMTGAWDVGV